MNKKLLSNTSYFRPAQSRQRIMLFAKKGYRILHEGNVIWSGLGHVNSYAPGFLMSILLRKWERLGDNFVEELDILASPGTFFEVQKFITTAKGRGLWLSIEAVCVSGSMVTQNRKRIAVQAA